MTLFKTKLIFHHLPSQMLNCFEWWENSTIAHFQPLTPLAPLDVFFSTTKSSSCLFEASKSWPKRTLAKEYVAGLRVSGSVCCMDYLDYLAYIRCREEVWHRDDLQDLKLFQDLKQIESHWISPKSRGCFYIHFSHWSQRRKIGSVYPHVVGCHRWCLSKRKFIGNRQSISSLFLQEVLAYPSRPLWGMAQWLHERKCALMIWLWPY